LYVSFFSDHGTELLQIFIGVNGRTLHDLIDWRLSRLKSEQQQSNNEGTHRLNLSAGAKVYP
jgi:hypothetical protein